MNPEEAIIIAHPDATEADLAAMRAMHPDMRVVAVVGKGDAAALRAALAYLGDLPVCMPPVVPEITIPIKPLPAVECAPFVGLDVPIIPARRKRRQEARRDAKARRYW